MDMQQIFKDCNAIISSVSLSKFRNKKVLILGANSFLASYIIAALMHANEKKKNNTKVHALSKNNLRSLSKELKKKYKNFLFFEKVNLVNLNVIKKKYLNNKYDFIFHCATYGQPEKWRNNLSETIVLNTSLLELLLNYCLKQKTKLMYFSSCDVYKNNNSRKHIDENFTQSHPDDDYRSVYSLSKILGEKLCKLYKKNYNLKTYIVRPAHTYGPGQTIYDRRFISQAIKRSLVEKKVYIYGKGKSIKTWGYISEITSMLLNIIQYGKSDIYNTTGNEYLSIKNIAKIIAKKTGVKFYQKKKGNNFASKDYTNVKVTSKKYHNEFKNKIIKVNINDGIERFIAWNKSVLNKNEIKKYF
jgi:dTDP-glucose 4,6-dehydratase/UDP-glucuronate decarboxylase